MTDDVFERARNLVTGREEAQERIRTLKSLKNFQDQTIQLRALHQTEYYFLTLTQEDIDVLIDHEEMKVGEYDRKFREL